MRIDFWTIGLQAINVLILVYILGRLFFRPIADAIAERQRQARALIADAERARADAEAQRDALSAQREAIAGERAEVLREASARAAEVREALCAEARAEADRIRTQAQAEIAQARTVHERALQREAARLAIDIAERILERLPASARTEGLAGRLERDLAAMAIETAIATGDEPGTVELAVAAPLDDGEARACTAALAATVAGPLDIAIVHDPALIAGYELRLTGMIVRDNARADLDRIAAGLSAPVERNET